MQAPSSKKRHGVRSLDMHEEAGPKANGNFREVHTLRRSLVLQWNGWLEADLHRALLLKTK